MYLFKGQNLIGAVEFSSQPFPLTRFCLGFLVCNRHIHGSSFHMTTLRECARSKDPSTFHWKLGAGATVDPSNQGKQQLQGIYLC